MLNNFDYNLIKTLILVFETNSMLSAAKALGVSAPTLTYSLNKLRRYYNDPLFIKMGKDLKVTPVAQQLYPKFKFIEEHFSIILMPEQGDEIDIKKISVRTNSFIEYLFMENIFSVSDAFDKVSFEFDNSILTDEQRINNMVSRHIDIDIGKPITVHNSLVCEHLFSSGFIGLCGKSHPRVGEKLTREQWLAEEHAMVSMKKKRCKLAHRFLWVIDAKKYTLCNGISY